MAGMGQLLLCRSAIFRGENALFHLSGLTPPFFAAYFQIADGERRAVRSMWAERVSEVPHYVERFAKGHPLNTVRGVRSEPRPEFGGFLAGNRWGEEVARFHRHRVPASGDLAGPVKRQQRLFERSVFATMLFP